MKRKKYFLCVNSRKVRRGLYIFCLRPRKKEKKEKKGRRGILPEKYALPSSVRRRSPLATHSQPFFPFPDLPYLDPTASEVGPNPLPPPHPRPTSRLSSVPRIPVHEIQRKEEKKEPLPPSSSGVRFVWQRVGLRSAGRSAKMPRQMEGRRRMGEVSSEERQKKEWRRRRKGVEIRATLRPEGKRVKEEERRKEGKA